MCKHVCAEWKEKWEEEAVERNTTRLSSLAPTCPYREYIRARNVNTHTALYDSALTALSEEENMRKKVDLPSLNEQGSGQGHSFF